MRQANTKLTDRENVLHVMFDEPEWVIYRVIWVDDGQKKSNVFEDRKKAEDFYGGCRLLNTCTYASISMLAIDVQSKVLMEQWRQV